MALNKNAKWTSIYVATEEEDIARDDYGVFAVDGTVRGERPNGKGRTPVSPTRNADGPTVMASARSA